MRHMTWSTIDYMISITRWSAHVYCIIQFWTYLICNIFNEQRTRSPKLDANANFVTQYFQILNTKCRDDIFIERGLETAPIERKSSKLDSVIKFANTGEIFYTWVYKYKAVFCAQVFKKKAMFCFNVFKWWANFCTQSYR